MSQEAKGGEPAMSQPGYWNERYSKAHDRATQLHEWYQDFESLEPFFTKHLFQVRQPESEPKILHLGSGDSTVPYDLFQRGYKGQSCIDFSSVVVTRMKARHADCEIEWIIGDVRDMPAIPSKSIDVAFDKGALDAMIPGPPWQPSDEVLQNTGKYLQEVSRILKDDGIFLCVTSWGFKLIEPILNRNKDWDIQMEALGDGLGMGCFGYILKKL